MFHLVEQPDPTTWIKHDDRRGVTCYVYFYDIGGPAGGVGGISCLPDTALKIGGE